MRTRVKFCGFTRQADVETAVKLGVDALGFVFYEASPRYIKPEQAAVLLHFVPAFVHTVGLFVNDSIETIQRTLKTAPLSCVQLHGDESWTFALQAGQVLQKPIIKAVRVNATTDWDEVAVQAKHVAGVLLDADAVGYGGSGHTFDWNIIPLSLRHKIILSGGLTPDNAARAIQTVQPYALDISSGIENDVKGIKDADKMAAFMHAVGAR